MLEAHRFRVLDAWESIESDHRALGISRDSLLGQRIWFSFDVQSLDGVVDGSVEGVGEGLIGGIMGFEVAPDGFDVVEFGRVFGQPLDAQPMGSANGLSQWAQPMGSANGRGRPVRPWSPCWYGPDRCRAR